MVIGIALVGSVSSMTGLTVGFGPVVLTHPTAIHVWGPSRWFTLRSSESR
jgi:hypothetical protein